MSPHRLSSAAPLLTDESVVLQIALIRRSVLVPVIHQSKTRRERLETRVQAKRMRRSNARRPAALERSWTSVICRIHRP